MICCIFICPSGTSLLKVSSWVKQICQILFLSSVAYTVSYTHSDDMSVDEFRFHVHFSVASKSSLFSTFRRTNSPHRPTCGVDRGGPQGDAHLSYQQLAESDSGVEQN